MNEVQTPDSILKSKKKKLTTKDEGSVSKVSPQRNNKVKKISTLKNVKESEGKASPITLMRAGTSTFLVEDVNVATTLPPLINPKKGDNVKEFRKQLGLKVEQELNAWIAQHGEQAKQKQK